MKNYKDNPTTNHATLNSCTWVLRRVRVIINHNRWCKMQSSSADAHIRLLYTQDHNARYPTSCTSVAANGSNLVVKQGQWPGECPSHTCGLWCTHRHGTRQPPSLATIPLMLTVTWSAGELPHLILKEAGALTGTISLPEDDIRMDWGSITWIFHGLPAMKKQKLELNK